MNNMWGSLAQFETIYWPWPIAIYLFLAGLSAGSIMVSLIVKWNHHKDNTNSIWDAMVKAGALLAPFSISLGLLLLIFDLGKPLNFYWLLITYNFGSVMSIGVLILLVYTPFAYLFAMIIFEKEIKNNLKFLTPIINLIRNFAVFAKNIEYFIFILSIGVGIYTGFLLSAIGKIPLWNTPILPILFLVSGFSSGIAANILIGMAFFKGELNKNSIKYLLILDLRAILLEIPLLFILFCGLYFENGIDRIVMMQALTHEIYGYIFWIGVVFIGLLTPIIIALTALKNHAYKPNYIVFNSFMVVFGVIFLRFYIVYAGQSCLGI